MVSIDLSTRVIFITGYFPNFLNDSEFDIDDVTEAGFTFRSVYQPTSRTPEFPNLDILKLPPGFLLYSLTFS